MLVSLNVSELLAGTLGEQVVTIRPEGDVLPVDLSANVLAFFTAQDDKVRRVEVVSGKVDANVTNEVTVKQVGTVEVTQGGEWVMRLASGATIPVFVQGGSIQASIAPGGIDTLARAIDEANVVQRELGFVSE